MDRSADGHAAFWAALDRVLPSEERETVEALIDRGLADALARWPGLGIAPDRFLSHWAGRVRGEELRARVEETHAADLYLAFACAEGNRIALRQLEAEWIAPLLPSLRRIDPSPQFLDETRQELLERLLLPREGRPARIAEYAGEAPLTHWLRAVVLRLALNRRRARIRSPEQPASDELVDLSAPLRDPQLEVLKNRYGAGFSGALRRVLGSVEGRDRALLRLQYVEGLSLSQIGAVYQVNKSTVSRWLTEVRELLLSRLRAELETQLGVAQAELDSLMRELASRIDVSLASVLRSGGE